MSGTDYARHARVPHPRDAAAVSRHWNDRLLSWVSGHVLASRVMFDVALIVPLVALPMSTGVKVTLGVVSGSWIQWWALPSLQRSANIADAAREAKADADHEALTHIAAQADALRRDLEAVRSGVGDARIAAETAAEAMKLLTSVLSPKAAGKAPKGKAGE